jgi:hypothetical protein
MGKLPGKICYLPFVTHLHNYVELQGTNICVSIKVDMRENQ